MKKNVMFYFLILFFSLTFNAQANQVCVSLPGRCYSEVGGFSFYQNQTIVLRKDVCLPGAYQCLNLPDPVSMLKDMDLRLQNMPQFINWSQYNDWQKNMSQSFAQNYNSVVNEVINQYSIKKIIKPEEFLKDLKGNQLDSVKLQSMQVKPLVGSHEVADMMQKAMGTTRLNLDSDTQHLDAYRKIKESVFIKEKEIFQPYVDSQADITKKIITESGKLVSDRAMDQATVVNTAYISTNLDASAEHLDREYGELADDSIQSMRSVRLISEKPKLFLTKDLNDLKKLKFIYGRLQSAQIKTRQQFLAQNYGLKAVDAADLNYSNDKREDGDFYYNLATMFADITLGIMPIVGPAKDLIEAVSGKSILTGESLSESARWIAGAGAVSLGLFGYFKAGIRLVKAAEVLEHGLPKVLSKSLNNVVVRAAEEVNLVLAKKGYALPAYKPGSRVWEFVTNTEIKGEFVRFYSLDKNMVGPWVVEKRLIMGLSKTQIKDKLALKYIPEFIVDVEIPAGVTLRKGIVNPIFESSGKRFSTQYEIVFEKLPAGISEENLFRNVRSLE